MTEWKTKSENRLCDAVGCSEIARVMCPSLEMPRQTCFEHAKYFEALK